MALNQQNVIAVSSGRAYVAPTGTAAPTSATSALDAALADLGYLAVGGITETYDDDFNEIRAFDGGVIVRRTVTSSSGTLAFTMIETKAETVELYHKGSQVTGGRIDVLTARADRRAFVIDAIDGENVIRFWIPNGEVTDRDAITYSAEGDPVSYAVTITAYPVGEVLLSKFYTSAAMV